LHPLNEHDHRRFNMAAAHALTNHDEIRTWAEQRDAQPACVKGTGNRGDTGMIRLDFPGFSGNGTLQPISWDAWFASFDENNLALLVQDRTARGQRSNFNKLVARRTAAGKQGSRRGDRRSGAATGGRSTGGRATRRGSTRKAGARKTIARSAPRTQKRAVNRSTRRRQPSGGRRAR
jgi:hypothetical protein